MTTTQTNEHIERRIAMLESDIEDLRAQAQEANENDLPTGAIRREIADCIEEINRLEALTQ